MSEWCSSSTAADSWGSQWPGKDGKTARGLREEAKIWADAYLWEDDVTGGERSQLCQGLELSFTQRTTEIVLTMVLV